MAVQGQTAQVRLANSNDGAAYWDLTATAAFFDTAAGAAVNVICSVSTAAGTLGAPTAPTAADISFMVDNTATQIKNIALTPSPNSTTQTFTFTATGLSGGSNRAGPIRLRVRLRQTGGIVATQYTVTSESGTYGTSTDALATATIVIIANVGVIRGTTTAATTLNQAVYNYPDVITATTVLGAAPFQSRTVNVLLTGKSTIASAASTTNTFTTALGSTDNTLPTLILATRNTTTTFPNASVAAVAWTVATPTEASATTDPRLAFVHDLQANDNTLGATPGSKNVVSGGRLTSDLDFITQRVVNQNSVGQNGITWNTDLYDVNQLVYTIAAPKRTAVISTTASGILGWGNVFQTWNEALPGGSWISKQTITAPSTATGLDFNNNRTLALIAANPNYYALIDMVDNTNPGTHLTAGNTFTIELTLRDRSARQYVILDNSPAPTVSILRIHPTTLKGQFLSQAGVWTDLWDGTSQVLTYSFPLTQASSDPFLWFLSIVSDSTWIPTAVFPVGLAYVGGTPYTTHSTGRIVSSNNPHDKHEFDATGLFM